MSRKDYYFASFDCLFLSHVSNITGMMNQRASSQPPWWCKTGGGINLIIIINNFE
tara:strand:- start:2477 stop:2641 length:165 start_codon:yes stop_codon:yes gene_type:complete